jgi:hypothetical protein
MTKELRIMTHGFKCQLGKIIIGENWIKQDIIDKVFMLYQSMTRT